MKDLTKRKTVKHFRQGYTRLNQCDTYIRISRKIVNISPTIFHISQVTNHKTSILQSILDRYHLLSSDQVSKYYFFLLLFRQRDSCYEETCLKELLTSFFLTFFSVFVLFFLFFDFFKYQTSFVQDTSRKNMITLRQKHVIFDNTCKTTSASSN